MQITQHRHFVVLRIYTDAPLMAVALLTYFRAITFPYIDPKNVKSDILLVFLRYNRQAPILKLILCEENTTSFHTLSHL
jgi:hypothetical protein